MQKKFWFARRHVLAALACYLILPVVAFAGGGETPISQGLSYLTTAMLGATGITIATLAVIAVGLACYCHKLEWSSFAYTLTAIAIVFGSETIAKAIYNLVR